MKTSNLLIAAALCAVILPAAAMASPILGTSGGNFTNLSSCDTGQDCRITTSSNGANTQVQWGTSSYFSNFYDPSTLVADNLSIATATNATNVKIAELTWFNSSNISYLTPDDFGVHYNLTISFSLPNVSSSSETFDLTIVSPLNPPGDVISSFTLPDLNALAFSLNGWTVSGLQYVADGGTSLCETNNTSWCNPEYNSGNLYIEANFTQASTPVPEPLTLSLFGAGLAGAAAFRRRRKQPKA